MKNCLIYLFLVALLCVSGCATISGSQSYSALELGMDKGQVLELMGSPKTTSRKDSIDSWFYDLEPPSKASRRVLQFDQGQLIYIGKYIPPPISAEVADELKKNPKAGDLKYKKHKRRYSEPELREILRKEVENKDPNFNRSQ